MLPLLVYFVQSLLVAYCQTMAPTPLPTSSPGKKQKHSILALIIPLVIGFILLSIPCIIHLYYRRKRLIGPDAHGKATKYVVEEGAEKPHLDKFHEINNENMDHEKRLHEAKVHEAEHDKNEHANQEHEAHEHHEPHVIEVKPLES